MFKDDDHFAWRRCCRPPGTPHGLKQNQWLGQKNIGILAHNHQGLWVSVHFQFKGPRVAYSTCLPHPYFTLIATPYNRLGWETITAPWTTNEFQMMSFSWKALTPWPPQTFQARLYSLLPIHFLSTSPGLIHARTLQKPWNHWRWEMKPVVVL